jgi:hypothetical protein
LKEPDLPAEKQASLRFKQTMTMSTLILVVHISYHIRCTYFAHEQSSFRVF